MEILKKKKKCTKGMEIYTNINKYKKWDLFSM